MRFSIVISVLGLSLAVTATPVAQSQPDQSVITCKNKMNDMFHDFSTLEKLMSSSFTDEGSLKYKEMESVVEKNTKNNVGECLKVVHFSSEEAPKFEDLLIEVLGKAEEIETIRPLTPKTVHYIVAIYGHFHEIYPEDYEKSLEIFRAVRSPLDSKFPKLCESYMICVNYF